MIKTLTVLGTRPEAIKLAPLLKELSSRKEFKSRLCSSGQHLEMLDGALGVFDLSVHHDLGLMRESQSLSGLTSRAMTGISCVVEKEDPDMVLVQGDTTTAFVGALAAFYQEIPVGHVEAGLRSGDKSNPFPEEINRRLADNLSDLYFAPTENSRKNLIEEGYPKNSVYVTGNTVIDALIRIENSIKKGEVQPEYPIDTTKFREKNKKLVLVTAHRRESQDGGITRISRALKRLSNEHSDLEVVFPVHLNPKVRQAVQKTLGEAENVKLVEPVDYLTFVGLMRVSHLIITDSGGIQEEAPTLGVPVLVARDNTERPEAIEAGTAIIVGTDTERIVREANKLLTDEELYEKFASRVNPFGEGDAAKKIAEGILNYFCLS
ncbi:UDP-N-acetylglucosamine 2-epimerase (non-hydrolyzing) [Candidatus Bipolaricaulota bacterium]|nr:UDP-N-acetylglucosamine 2-epimerase (non-hydrolyzing) [Candidatus Bipolaricaulota bacterium]